MFTLQVYHKIKTHRNVQNIILQISVDDHKGFKNNHFVNRGKN